MSAKTPTELRSFYSKLVSDAKADPSLMTKLKADPRAVVQERGLNPEEHDTLMSKLKMTPAITDSFCCCQGGLLSIPTL